MLWISRERTRTARRGRPPVERAARGSAWERSLLAPALIAPLLVAAAALVAGAGALASAAPVQDLDEELRALLAAERAAADDLRRRGQWDQAERALDTLIDEAAEEGELDWRSLARRARLELDRGAFERAESDAAAATDARPTGPADPDLAEAFAVRLELRAELGRTGDLDALTDALAAAGFAPGTAPRVDRALGALLVEAGRREAGRVRYDAAAARAAGLADGRDVPAGWSERVLWRELLAGARARRHLGDLPAAASLLVRAAGVGGREPQVLAELASLYVEADGEVADAAAAQRNPGPLLREARRTNPRSETALLTLIELYRLNWRRSHLEADALLAELLEVRPTSIAGRLAAVEGAILLGDRAGAGAQLAKVEALAPDRRRVRAYRASLTAIAADPAAAEEQLAALAQEDPSDAQPLRLVGTHLVELYRFTEAIDVLERAVARDPSDWNAWTALGRARANTGDVAGAREALERAIDTAAGRQDVVRNNLARVLRIVDERFVEHEDGELTFAWRDEGSDVLALYMVPFYAEARRELSERYGYSTGPVRIEVFDRHADFSVRSTGFEGFPALGVCFGQVVTAVSPLSELIGAFSWARTGYHEFTHVVHLGLSHNKCPRWVTEGLATWEEERKNPGWTRNMRRELLDARANGTVFTVRGLNGAFRGPRVIFGYYQSGLMCGMLIERYGFGSMLELLRAFDEGADLDTALARVFDRTPEELDAEFAEYVDAVLASIHVEPRWNAARLEPRWLTLPRSAPTGAEAARAWRGDWLDLAFAAWQSGQRQDAEEALRIAGVLGDDAEAVPPRALLLRAQFALTDERVEAGRDLLARFLEAGGEDFRARLALAELARAAGKLEEALGHLRAAERAFPGHPDRSIAAELALARLLEESGRSDEAMEARSRWIHYNADDVSTRLDLARWHADAGRHADAARLFERANHVAPFDRRLHLDWAESLVAIGAFDDALRECTAWEWVEAWTERRRTAAEAEGAEAEVAAAPSEVERVRVHVARGRAALGLGRDGLARAELERAQELAPDDPRVRALAEEWAQ